MVGVGSPKTFMQSETQRKNFMHDREVFSFCVPSFFKVEQKKQSWFYSREYIYFWLTIFRNDRVLLSCTVGPSFRNWIYEVMFNMFLSVEGENPLLELEKRRQVQRLMNNSWRITKCINAARLAQLVEHSSAEREVVASTPAEPTTRVFKKLVRSCWLLFKTLSQLRWSRRWVVTLSCWPWVEMLHTILLIGLNSKS